MVVAIPDSNDEPVLAEIVHRLVKAFHPQRVYLFGSRARGDDGPDSDYDLMVVVHEASEPGYRLAPAGTPLVVGPGGRRRCSGMDPASV